MALVVNRDTGQFLVCDDGTWMAECNCCLDPQVQAYGPADGHEYDAYNPAFNFGAAILARYVDTIELYVRLSASFPWTLQDTNTSPSYSASYAPFSLTYRPPFTPPYSFQWRLKLTNTCGATEVFTDTRTVTVWLGSSCSGCFPSLLHEYDATISGLVDFGIRNYSVFNGTWAMPWIDNYSPSDPHCWWAKTILHAESGWTGPSGSGSALLTLRQFIGSKYQVNLLYPDGWNSRWNTAAGSVCTLIASAYSLVQNPPANGSELVTVSGWSWP